MADDLTEIQRLHEEWDQPARNELLEQFEREIESWAQYRVSNRRDNDDLFADVHVSPSLDISSPPTVTTTTTSKPKRSKRKLESKAVQKLLRKCKKPRKRKVKAKRLLSADCDDKPSHDVMKVSNTRLSESQAVGGSSGTSTPKVNRRYDDHDTSFQTSTQQTNQQTNISLIHNQSSSINHENKSIHLSGKEELQLEGGRSMNIQQLVVPIIQDSPSPAQVAMLIVQSLAWDTVRMVRRSSYTEGFSIVLVKPKGMHEAPTLMAMENSKGDLTIPCDSLSNQRALFKIVGLLGEQPGVSCSSY